MIFSTVAEERRIAESAISTSAKLKTAFTSEKDQRIQLEKSLDEEKVVILANPNISPPS